MFCGEPLLILACRARPAPDYQFHPFFGTFPNSLIIKAPSPTTHSPAPGLSFQVNSNHLKKIFTSGHPLTIFLICSIVCTKLSPNPNFSPHQLREPTKDK